MESMKLMSRTKRIVCIVMIVAMMIATALPAMAAHSGDTFTVIPRRLNVRSGPGMSYSVITMAKKGKTVTYLSSKNGWWYVKLADGTTGYVDKDYLKSTGSSSSGSTSSGGYTVTASVLNIRTQPSLSGKIIGSLRKGATVTIKSKSGNWGQINYHGHTSWVSMKYLKKN